MVKSYPWPYNWSPNLTMNKHVFTGVFLLSVLSISLVNAQMPADIDPSSSTSSCAALSYDLRYRTRDIDTNNEVSALQDFLASAGYLNSEPTGYFGLATLAAVKKFQSSNSISPTGFVGPLTRGKIKAQSCDGAAPANTLSASPVSNNVSAPSQSSPTTVGNSTASATFDLGTLTTSSSYPALSGNAYGIGQPFGLALASAGGDKVWASGNIITTNNRWSVVVNQYLNPGLYTLTVYSANMPIGTTKLTVTGNSSTNTNATSTSGSSTVALPSCVIGTNKSTYTYGEQISISWESRNATYATFKLDTTGKDRLPLPSDKLYPTSATTITANVVGTSPIVLNVGNQNSNGTATCSAVVTISQVGTVSAPIVSSARLLDNNTKVNGGTPLYIKGTAANTDSVTVVLIGANYSGSNDYPTISAFLKGNSTTYEVVSAAATVANSEWVARFTAPSREGYYTVIVYDKNGSFLTTGTVYVSIKG